MLIRIGSELVRQRRFQRAEEIVRGAMTIGKQCDNAHDKSAALMLIEVYTKSERYEEARALLHRTMALIAKENRPEPNDLIDLFGKLGNVCHAQGKYAEAKAAFEHAVGGMESLSNPDPNRLAGYLAALADICHKSGKTEQELTILQRELAVRDSSPNTRDSEKLSALCNLSSAYRNQRRYADAEAMDRRAETIARDPKELVAAVCSRATTYLAANRFSEAEALFKHVLSVAEKEGLVLNVTHIEGLTEVYSRQKRFAEAELLCRNAIERSKNRKILLEDNELNKIRYALARILLHERKFAECEAMLGEVTLSKASSPELAELLTRLGEACLEAEKYLIGERYLRRAIEIYDRTSCNGEKAAALSLLCSIYTNLGKFPQAESICKQILTIERKQAGAEAGATETRLRLAELYCSQGKYSDAEAMIRNILSDCKKATKPAQADYMRRLATVLLSSGNYIEAGNAFQSALELLKKNSPRNFRDPGLVVDLAEVYRRREMFKEAESLFKEALQIQRNAPDSTPAKYAPYLQRLSNCYMGMGRLDEAEELRKEVVRIKERAFGSSRELADALLILSNLYMLTGRYAEAEPLRRRALDLEKKQFGQESLAACTKLCALGETLLSEGKYSQAEAQYKEAVLIAEKLGGTDNNALLVVPLSGLGDVYCNQGRYTEAEKHKKRALDLQSARMQMSHPAFIGLLSGLGVLSSKAKHYVAAEKFFSTAVALQQKQSGANHQYLVPLLSGLADAYRGEGRTVEARALYQRAVRIAEGISEVYPNMSSPLFGLAELTAHEKKYAEAQALYERALSIKVRQVGPAHPDLLPILSGLEEAYRHQNKFMQAAAVRRKIGSIKVPQHGPM